MDPKTTYIEEFHGIERNCTIVKDPSDAESF